MIKGEALSSVNRVRMVERGRADTSYWTNKLANAGSKDMPVTVIRGKIFFTAANMYNIKL